MKNHLERMLHDLTDDELTLIETLVNDMLEQRECATGEYNPSDTTELRCQ